MLLIFLSIALCTLSKSTVQIEKLINKIVINQVISYWPSYRSSASCIGPRLRLGPIQQTSGPVTGPIRNYLINNINTLKYRKLTYRLSMNAILSLIYYYITQHQSSLQNNLMVFELFIPFFEPGVPTRLQSRRNTTKNWTICW